MTNYAWSAKDRSGRTVIREIQADTAEASKAILLAQGYSELVLKEDDVREEDELLAECRQLVGEP